MMKPFLISVAACSLFAMNVCAQNTAVPDTVDWQAGACGSYGMNQQKPKFDALPNVPNCCPEFTSGSGNGINIGAWFRKELGSGIGLQLGAELQSLGGLITANENHILFRNGAEVNAVSEHSIDAKLQAISFIPSVSINPLNRLYVTLGADLALLTKATYAQKEMLVSPRNEVFENETKTRLQLSGDIQQRSSLVPSLRMGLSYGIPLDARGSMSLAPEVSYSLGVGNINKEVEWKVNVLRLGASLVYTSFTNSAFYPYTDPAVPDGKKPVSPDSKLPDPLAAILFKAPPQVKLYDNADSEIPQPLVVSNVITSNYFAMINYVFFDNNSDAIAPRYKQLDASETRNYEPSELTIKSTLDVYYQILNLIGKRMNQLSSTTITLVGCNADVGDEKANVGLSRRRATSIKKYLTDVWKVDENRIMIESRNLPATPSNSKTSDGQAENRRVEIVPSIPELLDPITFNDSLRQTNVAKFVMNTPVEAKSPVKAWTVDAFQSGVLLKTISGTGDIPRDITWKPDARADRIVTEQPIRIRAEAVDTNGRTAASDYTEVKVQQTSPKDLKNLRYSLITFGFNESSIPPSAQRIIDLIKRNISPRSTVTVIGYSDRIGASDYNKALSQQRAVEIAKILGVPETNAFGIGNDELIYKNDTPEGRFYCRTVMVNISTPLK
ncbi:MAG: OmpA family protein [Candidatus Kapabacteria bacterium]|nr:OmpA family protein [Candidatus Kapabacteria bacterium]